MYLIRVSLPDRPGSLGALATAVGLTGADIQAVEIVGRDDFGHVIDDLMVTLPTHVMIDNAVSACTGVDGASVLWCSRYPAGAGLESDIEALEKMVAEPAAAAAILADSAPVVFHCHWAVVLCRENQQVLHGTDMAPELDAEHVKLLGPLDLSHTTELPQNWVPEWVETTVAVAPIRRDRAIAIGRHGGPPFLGAEIARLRYLATMVPELSSRTEFPS